MVNIAIVGSRDFEDYEYLKNILVSHIINTDIFKETVRNDLYERSIKHDYIKYVSKHFKIISGGAKGADTLGERFAKDFNLDTLIFKPDWNMYGKSAGFVRNRKIIQNSDVVFAFWDGKSKGTKNSIDIAEELNKELHIVKYDRIEL